MAEDVVYTAVVNVSTNASETEQVVRTALQGMVAAAKQSQSALEATGGTSGLLRSLQDLIGVIDNFKSAMESVRATSAAQFSTGGAEAIKNAYREATVAVRSTLSAMAESGQITSRPFTQIAQGVQNTLATTASQSSRQIIAEQRTAGATNLPNAGNLDTYFRNFQGVPADLKAIFAPVEQAAKSLTAAVRDAASTNPDRQRAGLTALNQGLINKQETPGYPGLSDYPVIRTATDRASFATPSGQSYTYSPNGLRANVAPPPVPPTPSTPSDGLVEYNKAMALAEERNTTIQNAVAESGGKLNIAQNVVKNAYEALANIGAGASDSELRSAANAYYRASNAAVVQLEAQAAAAAAAGPAAEKLAEEERLAAEKIAIAADNAARASRVSSQLGTQSPGTIPLAGGYALSAAEGGVVDANGKLVTSMEELVAVSRAAGPALDRAAKAQDAQNRSLGASYLHGLTQGGWAGGQGGGNPLGGLLETAGVLTKYALVGRSLEEVSRLARETLIDYANLDKAIAAYNQVIGGSDAANNSFVNSLENISRAAGVNTVDALNAATKGVAAFSTETTTASQKQQIGKQFVTAATQNAVITGQPVGAAANDLIAIGTSFDIAAGGLNQINDAIATAHSLFGSSTLDISNGLKLLADDGKQAGYSMTELTQVVGLDAARLAESGDEVATNLQRVFAQFQSKAGQGALQSVGVDTTGSVKSQIEGLANVYDGLSTKQQQFILNTLGGAKAMKELVPLITDNADLQNAFAKSLDNSGAGANLANAQMQSLAGQLKVIGETIKNIGLDIARSGIFEPLILAIGALKPLLQLLDSILQVWDKAPNIFKGATATILEAVLAFKLLAGAREKALAIGGTGSLTSLVGNITGRGRGGGALAAATGGADAASTKIALNELAEARALEAQASAEVAEGSLSAAAAEKVLASAATATSEALARLIAVANGATIGRTGDLVPATRATRVAREATAGEAAVGEATVGEAALAGGVAAEAGGGLLAALTSPLAIGVIVAAVTTYSVIRDISAVVKAVNGADAAGDNAQAQAASNTPDALAASANALRDQANEAKKAAGSLFGITNLLTGGSGRRAAAYDDRQATVLSTEAQAKEKIQNTAGSTGTATNVLDFSGLTALQTSITTLSSNGLDAADTTRALNAALDGLGSSAGLAISKVGAQQAGVEAQAAALLSLNTVANQASRTPSRAVQDQGIDALSNQSGEKAYQAAVRANPLGGGDTALTKLLSGTVRGNISAAVGSVETSYIGNHPEMTPAQLDELQRAADIQVKNNTPNWDKLTQQERNALLTGINTGVASAVKTAKAAGTINGATDLQSLVAAANTATAGAGAIGTEAGNVAYSNNGDVGLATAKANAASLAQTYIAVEGVAKRLGIDASGLLHSIQEQYFTAAQAVDTAAIAQATALAGLALALESPFDKAGQIASQLQAAQAAVATAKGSAAKIAALTNLASVTNQQVQQAAADVGSHAADVAGYNKVSIDAATVAGDTANLNAAAALQRQNGPQAGQPGYTGDSQGVQDLLKKRQDDLVQQAKDAATQQSAVARAQIDPRSVLALDTQSISGLIAQIHATPGDDQDTLASLNTQLKAARVQQLQDSIAVSNASIASSVFPGSAVEAASAALAEALNTLSGDEKGTAQWFNDYAALKAAQIGLGEANLKAAQQAGVLSIDTTNPVAVAQKALSDAQGQLAYDQSKKAPADVINADKANVSSANQASLSAQFTQNIGDAQIADQLGQISHQAYLTYLKNQQQRLLQQQAGMKAGTEGYRQLTDELNTLGQDILAANNQLIGQFNIGDIKVPTPYEVRRSLATQAIGQQYQSTNSSVVINVNGTNYDSVVQLLGTYLGPVTTGQYTLSARKVS